jgi:hypothetical protein
LVYTIAQRHNFHDTKCLVHLAVLNWCITVLLQLGLDGLHQLYLLQQHNQVRKERWWSLSATFNGWAGAQICWANVFRLLSRLMFQCTLVSLSLGFLIV